MARRSFDDLVGEATNAPIAGWDFSWLEGRATEERPPWGYARLVGERSVRARRHLDLQTGGAELVDAIPTPAPLLVVTESWRPNVTVAGRRLPHRVVEAVDDLPFASGAFDLVTSRHPVDTPWLEIARVLEPGGTCLSQQVGPRSAFEVTEHFLGPQPPSEHRSPQRARADAIAAGLDVVDLREARLRMTFDDIGAVVYFLRLVVWIVPGFADDIAAHTDALRDLHERIERDGPFVAHSTRFLIEARRRRSG